MVLNKQGALGSTAEADTVRAFINILGHEARGTLCIFSDSLNDIATSSIQIEHLVQINPMCYIELRKSLKCAIITNRVNKALAVLETVPQGLFLSPVFSVYKADLNTLFSFGGTALQEVDRKVEEGPFGGLANGERLWV